MHKHNAPQQTCFPASYLSGSSREMTDVKMIHFLSYEHLWIMFKKRKKSLEEMSKRNTGWPVIDDDGESDVWL